MSFAIPFAASVVLIGLLGWLNRKRARSRFFALAWPKRMGFHAFRNKVERYLRHNGWAVSELPFSPWPLRAEKAGASIALQCYPAGTTFSSHIIQDMDALANQLVKTRYMDTGLVAVLAEALPQELREEAAARNVNILFYKDLAEFADIPKPTHEAIEAQFNTIGLDNWALVRLSQRHLAAKDLAAAENAARLAAKRVTGNPAVLAHLSDVLRLRGDHAGALEILLDAVKIHPQNAWCHFRLSRIYLEKGNIDAAKEAAQIAARLEPKDDFLCRHLSQVLGKVEESRT